MKKYRLNVGIVVFNKHGKVLLCRRKGTTGKYSWQFPQGGVEKGESFSEAGFRELAEETSVSSVRLVSEMKKFLYYDFPDNVYRKMQNSEKGQYAGQKQRWLLLYFYGDDAEINLNTAEPEFSKYEWVDMSESIERVWFAKKHVYIKVCAAFSPIISEFNSF